MNGKVYLVGAGPGDPELLTVKAYRILREADVVLHDDLVNPAILELASPAAQIVNVGKRCGRREITQPEINSRMVEYARAGLAVVRLKGGDPLVFGRAGEEMEALREAEVEFEIVPGVTAAFAAAAAAGIPLTDRRLASSLVFLTGHLASDKDPEGHSGWPALDSPDATLVIYMPGSDYAHMASEVRAAGVPAETPCLIVSNASSGNEGVHLATLETLAESPQLPSPKLLIVGAVAGLARGIRLQHETSDAELVCVRR
ncbi:MAG TPA: uroporphyrinogen-III C-methyltransferase [Terriglobia bacterium]|nr:uroporphyrinogen-III C-methyltransferase [Terriglobia bacterium]